MDLPVLDTTPRLETGKGPARRLRTQGLVPAVLYGVDMEPLLLSVEPKTLRNALSGPLHINTVLKLSIGTAGKKATGEYTARVCDHQYDPVSRELLHVDFHIVDLTKKIQLDVPFIAEGRSLGEQTGGVLSAPFRTLPVECLPTQIPSEISVDISHLDVGDSISISDLELIEGAEILMPIETTVISIIVPQAEEEEVKPEDEEGVEGEEGETAEGEEDKEKADEKSDDKDKKSSDGK